MPASMQLNAAAFISPQNHPILVRNFTPNKQDDLKYNFAAHTSLDVIDERLTNPKQNECYLGLLYATDDLAVYGYVTPTRLRIIIILALCDAVVRDADVVLIFKALHSAYRRSLANPFLKMYSGVDADAVTLLSGDGTKRFEMFQRRVDEVGQAITGTTNIARV